MQRKHAISIDFCVAKCIQFPYYICPQRNESLISDLFWSLAVNHSDLSERDAMSATRYLDTVEVQAFDFSDICQKYEDWSIHYLQRVCDVWAVC